MPLSLMDVFGTSKPTQDDIDERRGELKQLRKNGLISPTLFKNQALFINSVEQKLLNKDYFKEIDASVKQIKFKKSIKIVKTGTKTSSVGMTVNNYDVNFKGFKIVSDCVSSIIKQCLKDVKIGDKISFKFNLDDAYVSTKFKTYIDFESIYNDAMNILDKLITSPKSEGYIIENLKVFFAYIPIQAGGKHCPKRMLGDLNDWKTKKSILQIKNNDNLCLEWCLLIGSARLLKNSLKILHDDEKDVKKRNELSLKLKSVILDYDGLRHGEKNIKQRAEILRLTYGDIHQLAPFDYIEKASKVIKFRVVCFDYEKNNLAYSFGNEYEDTIFVAYHDKHYDLVVSPSGYLAVNYYCEFCLKSYSDKDSHRCIKKCSCCLTTECKSTNKKTTFECNNCYRKFKDFDCHNLHLKATCDRLSVCGSCNEAVIAKKYKSNLSEDVFVLSKSTHKCGYKICVNCNEYVEKTHKCFMIPKKVKKHNEKLMFYDVETNPIDKHIITLVVVQDFNGTEWVFKTMDEFGEWLFDPKTPHKGYTFIAHNASGYDSHFIYNYYLGSGRNNNSPSVIWNGNNILEMKFPAYGLRFIDSYRFLNFPLASFPKAFGLTELAKGHFPHWFVELDYVGKMPDIQYFHPDGMKTDGRKQFLEWYELHKNDAWNYREEQLKYCRSDVDILRKACINFRQEFISLINLDPFTYCTIAGVSISTYFAKFLKHDTISYEERSEKMATNQSKEAMEWLSWVSNSKKINIEHAGNGGERKIDGYSVDGYFNGTVYEYNGCSFHGCPKCYRAEMMNKHLNKSMGSLYNSTLKKMSALKLKNNVVEMWSCKWNKIKKSNNDIRQFIKSADIQKITPLNTRDSFFGGRTEPFHRAYSCDDDEEILYLDFTSLYPAINNYGTYPVGHPRKIYKDFTGDYFGFQKCKILAPRELYIPVLPVKVEMEKSEKLIFGLCRTCAETRNAVCTHSDNERAFIGTWATEEIKLAVEKGYKVLETYEVWDYDKSDNLFKDYVKMFYEMKQKATIEKNPCRRVIAKILLNSLWGKFGESEKYDDTKTVYDNVELLKLINDTTFEDFDVVFINEKCVVMSYKRKAENLQAKKSVSIEIASYTTALARVKLYRSMDTIINNGNKILYCDTDSILFVKKKNAPCPVPIAEDELGVLKIEKVLKKYVGIAPKSYCYEDIDGKVEVVCKGINLNYENSNLLTFEKMGEIMLGLIEKVEVVERTKIVKKKCEGLKSVSATKIFRDTFDKRIVEAGDLKYCNSKPYGF